MQSCCVMKRVKTFSKIFVVIFMIIIRTIGGCLLLHITDHITSDFSPFSPIKSPLIHQDKIFLEKLSNVYKEQSP